MNDFVIETFGSGWVLGWIARKALADSVERWLSQMCDHCGEPERFCVLCPDCEQLCCEDCGRVECVC